MVEGPGQGSLASHQSRIRRSVARPRLADRQKLRLCPFEAHEVPPWLYRLRERGWLLLNNSKEHWKLLEAWSWIGRLVCFGGDQAVACLPFGDMLLEFSHRRFDDHPRRKVVLRKDIHFLCLQVIDGGFQERKGTKLVLRGPEAPLPNFRLKGRTYVGLAFEMLSSIVSSDEEL